MAYKSRHSLDPRVVAMLPDIYTASQLEYAKGVVSGEIKPTYFKASDIPEKKAVPEAFKKKHKAKRTKRISSEFSHDDMVGAINHRIIVGDSRQQVIQALVDRFKVSKHSAGYHYDKFVGKR